MIKETDRKKFLAITEEPQAKDIAEKLNAAGHKPRKGKAYNNNIISRVIRGDQADETAELFIFRHYKEIKGRKEEMERLKRELEAPAQSAINEIEVHEPETVKP